MQFTLQSRRGQMGAAALSSALLALQVLWLAQFIAGGESARNPIFSDVDVVVVMGGADGQPIFEAVRAGAYAAGRDLGCNVRVYAADWTEKRLLDAFASAVIRQPDGIGLIGFPSQSELIPQIRDARSQGILVTGLNVPIDSMEAAFGPEGYGYAGENTRESGKQLALKAPRWFDLKPGDRALILGSFTEPGRSERARSCYDTLIASGMAVDVFDTDQPESWTRGMTIPERFVAYLEEEPRTRLCIYDTGSLLALAEAMHEADIPPARIALAGFDHDEEAQGAMALGYRCLVHDQQPFLQGYLPVLQICLTEKFGAGGLKFDTSSRFYGNEGELSGEVNSS